MTDDRITLRELLEKGSDATFLREMIGFAAQRLMELETEALCGAAHGERAEGRTNQRNGYRTGTGRRARARSNSASLNSGAARISRLSSTRAGRRRRR